MRIWVTWASRSGTGRPREGTCGVFCREHVRRNPSALAARTHLVPTCHPESLAYTCFSLLRAAHLLLSRLLLLALGLPLGGGDAGRKPVHRVKAAMLGSYTLLLSITKKCQAQWKVLGWQGGRQRPAAYGMDASPLKLADTRRRDTPHLVYSAWCSSTQASTASVCSSLWCGGQRNRGLRWGLRFEDRGHRLQAAAGQRRDLRVLLLR